MENEIKTYEVTIPIVGMAFVTVDAASEEDAIHEALAVAGPEDVSEWEALRHVVRGNVCYVSPSSARAEEV